MTETMADPTMSGRRRWIPNVSDERTAACSAPNEDAGIVNTFKLIGSADGGSLSNTNSTRQILAIDLLPPALIIYEYASSRNSETIVTPDYTLWLSPLIYGCKEIVMFH